MLQGMVRKMGPGNQNGARQQGDPVVGSSGVCTTMTDDQGVPGPQGFSAALDLWCPEDQKTRWAQGLQMQEQNAPDLYHPPAMLQLVQNLFWADSSPIRKGICPVLPLPHVRKAHVPHPTSKWATRFLPWSFVPGYKVRQLTHIQGLFSLTSRKLACCPRSSPYAQILFSFILSHVWKFFSILHTDTDKNHVAGMKHWEYLRLH